MPPGRRKMGTPQSRQNQRQSQFDIGAHAQTPAALGRARRRMGLTDRVTDPIVADIEARRERESRRRRSR